MTTAKTTLVMTGAALAIAAACERGGSKASEGSAAAESAGSGTAAASAEGEAAASAEGEAAASVGGEAAGDDAGGAAVGGGLLEEGTPAPDFTAEAHDGTEVTLSELRGRPVVLYFYPKDDTPGCTVEAESFRDDHGAFQKADAEVLGVSLDSLESHRAFAEAHDLPFRLLSDEDRELTAKYGVSTEGGYAERVTFVIDQGGRIAEVYPGVDVRGHADEVLAAVRAL